MLASTFRRRLAAVAAAVAALIALTGCMNPEERSFFDRTNALRAANGLAAYRENNDLDNKAQAWARRMAGEARLYHSDLREGTEMLDWRLLGENVGRAADSANVDAVLHDALVASPGHRANLLSARFTHMGVGVARGGDGNVYVAEVFAELR